MTVSIPQSTSYVVVFKAYLASDHLTEATGKTIAITISKNGGAFGNPNAGATNATAISSGWYKFTLDTTDTDTVGPIAYRGAEATIDDVGGWLNVTAEQADITAIKTKTDFLPSATAGAAGGVFIAGTNAATTVTTSFTTTFTGNLTGSVASVTGAVGSVTGNVGGNVTGSVGSVTGAVGSVTGGVNVTQFGGTNGNFSAGRPEVNITHWRGAQPSTLTSGRVEVLVGAMAADVLTAAATAADFTTEIQAGLATAAALATVDDFIDTEVSAIKAVTDKLDTALELDGAVYRYTTNSLEQAPTGGGAADGSGFTAIPWNPAWDAEVQSEAADAITAASLATAANLATVDTVVDAIKAKTDSLTFTKALELDVNMQSINGVTLVGDGVSPKFGV